MIVITDDQDELFDIVDKNDKVIGKAKRGEVHKNKKLIHRSVGVVLFNKEGKIFLTKRSPTKDTDPNKWTIACSGHVNRNIKYQKSNIKNKDKIEKIYEEAAHRELIEELGVDLDIKPVCKYICRAAKETEIVVLYQVVYDSPFRLNKEEITQGKFVTRKEFQEAVRVQIIELSYMGKAALERIGWID